jgi:uncharacterized protein (DUF1330 family)
MSEGAVLVVVEILKLHDADEMKKYQEGARPQIGKYGGVVIARGGNAVEGTPPFGVMMIQKWPSAGAFVAWQSSEEYRPLMERRKLCADLRIAIVPMIG